MKAKLVLQDGTIFEGTAFGAATSRAGEVVFATGMVGYDQSLTDPSYEGQILNFTYPLIGNWGVPPRAMWESGKVHVSGLIISDLTTKPSHWQSEKTLDAWLKEQDVPGIHGIDTRRLTQKLREHGVMLGKIMTGKDARLAEDSPRSEFGAGGESRRVKFVDPNLRNLVAEVSPKKIKVHSPVGVQPLTGVGPLNIGLLNCGAKKNIVRSLLKRGVTVYELPWNYDPFKANLKLDGLMISNGPGDPKMAKETIQIIKKSMSQKLPTFGICLGNQLLALAAGGDTYKLKFGHRAQNQPTIQVGTNRCFITTQNHGFTVDETKMPSDFSRWFYNANDNTNEGIIHKTLPFFSVQFHPEATPGPTDTDWLFDYFLERIKQ